MRAHPHPRDGGYERKQDMLRRCGREHDPRAEHERELEQALLGRGRSRSCGAPYETLAIRETHAPHSIGYSILV